MAGSGPRMVALAGIGITLIGLPIYLIMTRKKAEQIKDILYLISEKKNTGDRF